LSGASGSAGAGGAPECVGDLAGCFDGNQPRVCLDGKWTDAGGKCNFGCSSGKCECSAPARFQPEWTGIPGVASPDITDAVLKKTWHIRDGGGSYDSAKVQCGTTARLPTLSEAQSIVAQQPDAIQCGDTKNLDSYFFKSIGYNADSISLNTPIWTGDLDPSGMAFTLQLTTGKVATRDPIESLSVLILCIDKDPVSGASGASGAAGSSGSSGAAGAGGSSGGSGGSGGAGGAGGSGGSPACEVGPAFSFDQDDAMFVSTGTASSWAWGVPSGSASPPGDHSTGTGKLWGTNATGTSNLCENSALESVDIDLTAYAGKSVTLEAWAWLDLRECDASASPTCTILGTTVCKYDALSGGTSYSGGVLQVSDGLTWTTVAPNEGYQSGTMKIECHSSSTPPPPSTPVEVCDPCDLDGQVGFTANSPQKAWTKLSWDLSFYAAAPFRVRFKFASYFDDPCWPNSGGWYVDDIRFTTPCP
jgi:hypothetical protein